MNKLVVVLFILATHPLCYGQNYEKFQSRHKHKNRINYIAASDSCFATSSDDQSVIVWDYDGKVIYSYKLDDGKINSLCFIPESKSLLIGITERKGNEIKRHVVKRMNALGKLEYELIDTTLTQEYANNLFDKNTVGARNAINSISTSLPQLNIKKELRTPPVKQEVSHIELIHSITVSPTKNILATIDKFNILKLWNSDGHIVNSLKITNNKKDTNIYFRSDSTLFIEPNIILNIRDLSTQIIQGFERYSGIPLGNTIYFHFNYNIESRPEKLYNLNNHTTVKEFNSKTHYTIFGSSSNDHYALLGADRQIRIISKEGELLTTLGKDRVEMTTFRGEQIQLFSKISTIASSPNGEYIISGDENGKLVIWKQNGI